MFGKTEDLIVVLVIVLVLFGAKLPELSKGIAESVKEVRKGFKDEPTPSQTASRSQISKKSESTKA